MNAVSEMSQQRRRYSAIEAAANIVQWNTDEEENSEDNIKIEVPKDDEISNLSSELSCDEETESSPARPTGTGDIPRSSTSLPAVTLNGRDQTLWKSIPSHTCTSMQGFGAGAGAARSRGSDPEPEPEPEPLKYHGSGSGLIGNLNACHKKI